MNVTCVQCKAEIPLGACQQGQNIHGTWYPLHVGCADLWANEIIPVWIVDFDGDLAHSEGCLQTVQSYIADMEPGTKMEIERGEIKRIEYLNMEEL